MKQHESKHFIEEIHACVENVTVDFVHNNIPIHLKCKIVEHGLTVRNKSKRYLHNAPPFCRLFFIKQGSAKILINKNDSSEQAPVEYELQAGKSYFIPEKNPFEISYYPPEELFHCHIYVTDSIGKSILGKIQEVKEINIPTAISRFEHNFKIGNRLGLWGVVIDCVSDLIYDQLDVLAKESEQNRKFSLLFQYLNDTPLASVSIADLADLYSISASALSKRFKKNIGISLKSYLTDLILAKAQYLLIHSNKTISEIALELGFSDSQYFHRFFKKQCSITPGQFTRFQ
jgi:AraC-like DNA-binding protein